MHKVMLIQVEGKVIEIYWNEGTNYVPRPGQEIGKKNHV